MRNLPKSLKLTQGFNCFDTRGDHRGLQKLLDPLTATSELRSVGRIVNERAFVL